MPHFVSKRKQEPALPRPFELPVNFSPEIMAGLQEEHLVGNPRRKFITAIANAIFRFKSYPTDEEYHHVAQQVIKKWKFLDTGGGCVSYMLSSIILKYIITLILTFIGILGDWI